LLNLSSGEISLSDHMAAAGKSIKAGQETRLADIPAVPFSGYGVFDQLNGHPSGAALSVAIREAAAKHYGAVGLEFIEHVARIQDTLSERLKAFTAQFVADVVPQGASGQVDRVAKRFALVAAALELAGEFGLTGWDQGEGTRAVCACFHDWLHQRGGAGDFEEAAILSQVRAFFEANGESRFSDWDSTERAANGIEPERRIVVNRVGFRRKSRSDGYTYFVLPEAFKREICAGLNPDRAVSVLRERGWIEPDASGKNSQSQRLPGLGKKTRCYVFTPKMWESP
jgi:putative DNA primase/helicase